MVDHKNNKRKKYHDKDKYYNLAKEQGLRSRAAFKLSQINRQYALLDKAKVVLDLCAAPGGWTQIAARTCGSTCQIVAVDILPIRGFPRSSNVTTLIGDITTDKCKADIQRAVLGAAATASNINNTNNNKQGLVDVVLHDGAPNVGASYDKDAYQQIELAVHALRCATQHLKRGGSFVTKIYRSRDSASYLWVLQQLFQSVSTFKPKASRQQSAEIFYIAERYFQPDKIDPRLLDPKHIFEYVEGDTTQASNLASSASSKFNVFHKSWDKAKRQRGGYDTEHLDFITLRHVEPLCKFVFAKTNMDAIQALSSCSAFSFQCDECTNHDAKTKTNSKASSTSSPTCPCAFLLNHPLTSQEIKECVVDLKLLNKGDFKGLMTWRDKMTASWKESKSNNTNGKNENDDDSGDDDDDDDANTSKASEQDDDEEEDEDAIQEEIQKLRERKQRERKKLKKRERKIASKKRQQAALGMDLNAIDVQEHDQFFSLATLQSAHDLDQVAEVNLDQVTDEQAFGKADDSDDDDDNDQEQGMVPDKDDETGYSYRLERDLDFAYERYLQTTKNGEAKVGTKAAKRSKKLMREKLAQESHEDHELLLTNKTGVDHDTKTYVKLLQGPKDSDDEDDSSDEDEYNGHDSDGYDDDPMTPEEHHAKKKQKLLGIVNTSTNPLIHKVQDEPTSVKTARWFSNPLFAQIGQAVNDATAPALSKSEPEAMQDDDDDDSRVEDSENEEDSVADDESEEEAKSRNKRASKNSNKVKDRMDADDVMALMPKTDKQKRHEKRLKALERDERRQKRKAKKLGESASDFDLVPGNADSEDDDDDEMMRMEGMSEEKKMKLMEARKLIKAGMGTTTSQDKVSGKTGFEVVEQERPLPVKDDRKYDSEHEDYDSDDYAKTMALGTMMLRQSKAKALVDASYNRFAWNDPNDLPEWFVDDENRHYRPQLPIPPALLAKMKEKMAALSTKPIAKVAEARARKNRRAKLKLAAAKKKAQSVANSTDMTEAMKLKSISKALRSEDGKKGGRQYVVSKKGQGKQGVKGAKMVDKRLKSDKRSMERASKKRKAGKKGGFTGSKRRRHHK
ncbi:23S rRNA methylase [Nitzschia inconspicua]|uniref:23S rRNA methylase n=1 Tax=Nitzschia inconspicua TaxID=303405 RepID=A0A9K3KJ54_9STRA|nr:23S rRNA methylase [Nitzschia inconspicua]